MSDEWAGLIRKSARLALDRATRALALLDKKPTVWRASPIFERDIHEVRAGLERIRQSAEEVLRL